MAALHSFQFSTLQISVTLFYFFIDFDQVCGRLHGLIVAHISDSLVFNVVIPFNSLHAG